MAKTGTGSTMVAKTKAVPPVAPVKNPRVIALVPKQAVVGKAKKAAAAKAANAKQAVAKRGRSQNAAPHKAPAKPAAGKASTVRKIAAAKTSTQKRASLAAKTPAPATAAAKKSVVAATRVSKALPAVKAAPPSKAAKAAAPKNSAVRRPATRPSVPAPVARRVRTAGASRKAPAPPPRQAQAAAAPATTVRPPQVFTVSHLNHADFKADGLRSYAQYRDLGIAAATGGLCQAHVIRFTPPCTDEVRKRHTHMTELQLIYVLQGWMKNEFEGHGEQMMSTGSCWLQPSGIKHTVLDYSADCEVLEIIVPADFKTEELT